MKRVKTSLLVPGMIVSREVRNVNDTLVMAKDTVLTDADITKLAFHGIYAIYIKEEADMLPPVYEEVESSQGHSKFKESEEFQVFKENYEKEVEGLESAFTDIISTKTQKLKISELCKKVTGIKEDTRGGIHAFDILHSIRNYDDSTFNHSMNVALICNVFADWMHMSAMEKELATVCGLLHDIGKLRIPEDIVKKTTRLTDEEYETVKTHPLEGYNILFEAKFNVSIQNTALMHHERYDGSGYPMGLKGNQIDKYAKMVSIADVYDAMTATRAYRGAISPFRVIEMFEKEGLGMFDPEYILVFMEHIVQAYIRKEVRLNDGRIGEIVMLNKQKLSRPVVMCGNDFINLVEHPELMIEEILV
ncbi:MAG: HD-GYP domain-containing protein [Lachnospiraceae bacterium]|nr:HD-GYP domain-containing protein [Lachnospiraceae bacterium]